MKTIKVMFAALLVAAVGFTVSAYTAPKAPVTEGWFRLIDPSHPELASSYEYVGEMQPCSGEETLCAIKGTINPATTDEPYQSDVNDAKSASINFSVPVPGEVAFEE